MRCRPIQLTYEVNKHILTKLVKFLFIGIYFVKHVLTRDSLIELALAERIKGNLKKPTKYLFIGFSCFLCCFHQPSTFPLAIRLPFFSSEKGKKTPDRRLRSFRLHVQESKAESTCQSERGNFSIHLSIGLYTGKNVYKKKFWPIKTVNKHRLRCLTGRMTIGSGREPNLVPDLIRILFDAWPWEIWVIDLVT